MKVVILAGGLGSRISEKTHDRPKPMIEIGGRPILCHIMDIYSDFGFNEFIIALGYRGDCIKEYFLNYYYKNNDLTVNTTTGKTKVHLKKNPNWTIHLVDTGLHTQTGGRVKRLQDWIGEERFMLTYGDGLADLNVRELVKFHESHGKKATITAVRPPARFGGLSFEGQRVKQFSEKPQIGEGWINGGFFVLEPEVFDYLDGDNTILERGPLEKLAEDGELVAYKHDGFWQPMDTLREYNYLEALWESDQAPWKNLEEKIKISRAKEKLKETLKSVNV